jgi:hypothetical protein
MKTAEPVFFRVPSPPGFTGIFSGISPDFPRGTKKPPEKTRQQIPVTS